MKEPINLNGTMWRCTDEDMPECGMTCTVIDGEINPDWNGDNDIEIEYQNGAIAYMKYRRFVKCFKRILPAPIDQSSKQPVKGRFSNHADAPSFFDSSDSVIS
jgi:hypothetical protein